MSHLHSVYDTDKHFVIDPITRNISTESDKLVLTRYDHNSERFTFEIPRYIEGHDMFECNQIEIHADNISKNKSECNSDVYTVDDKQLSPDDENIVIFSWLISRAFTQIVGKLSFSIDFACIAEDGVEEYSWGTNDFEKVKINDRTHNTQKITEEYSSFIGEVKSMVDNTSKKINDFDKAIDELKNKKSLCIVEITNVNGEFSADKTTTEIVDMYKNGVAVFAEFAGDVYHLNYAGINYCGFSFISGSVSKEISINSDGEAFFKTRTLVREEYDEENDISLPGGTTSIFDAIYAAYDKSDVFIVNVTLHDDGSYSVDRTYAEIVDAYNMDKAVICKQGVYVFNLYEVTPVYALFESIYIDKQYIRRTLLTIFFDGSVTHSYMDNAFIDNVKNVEFDINTTNKTIVGAINEINDDIKVVLENYEQKLEEATRSIDSIGNIIDEINGEVI